MRSGARPGGHLGERLAVPIAEAVAEFTGDLAAQGRSGTAESYRHALKPLLALDAPTVAHVTPAELRALMAERARQVQPSTLVTFHAVLSALFRWCVERGYRASSPMAEVAKPKQRRPPHRYLTAAQLAACWRGCRNDTQRAILLLCGGCGLRSAEALGLRWRDVDLAQGTARVLGKGTKWRTVHLDPLTVAVLAGIRGDGYILPLRSPDALRSRVRTIARRAGIARCTVHELRHSFAVNWLLETGDAASLQELLGHASPVMTAYYTRDVRAEAALRKAAVVDLAARLFGDGAESR